MLANIYDAPLATEQEKSPFAAAREQADRSLCEAAYRVTDNFWSVQPGSTGESPVLLVKTLESIGRGHSNQCFRGSRTTIQEFLEQLYNAPNGVDQSKAISEVFTWINDVLLFASRSAFSACDDLLQCVNVDRLSYPVMLSFLTFTFTARDQLKQRQSLWERIWNRIAVERGELAAEQLLKTLT